MPTPPAVLLGTVGSGRQTVNNTPLTFPHTVAADTDALLVFAGWVDFFVSGPPTVTYGGVDVPALWTDGVTTEVRPTWFLLPYPTAGTANVVVTPAGVPFLGSLTGFALNLGAYGGIRFGEADLDNIPPFVDPSGAVYNSSTDLVIDVVVSRLQSGVTFTPGMGQTLLVAQDGFADTAAKCAASQGVGAASTAFSWTLTPAAEFFHFMLAIKGLDGVPAGAPTSVGPVTNTQTLGQQPADTSGPKAAWRWRHEVPSTHRFLAVLIETFDSVFTPVTGVTFTLPGGSPQSLTFRPQDAVPGPTNINGSLWYLENAPVGIGYIQVTLAARRWFDAGAYSLNVATGAADLIACVARSGLTASLDVPSLSGAIVLDLIKAHGEPSQTFDPAIGQTRWFAQPIYNAGPNISGQTEEGAGSMATASGATTTMAWTPTPLTTTEQIGFSFLGVAPPPPPPTSIGCPNSLPVPAVTGTGCSGQVSSPAV